MKIVDQGGAPRLISFAEFENAWHTDGRVKQLLDIVTDVFTGFHPRTRPILWRVLIAQAVIYHLLDQMEDANAASPDQFKNIPLEDRDRFDWRETLDEATDEEVLSEPFAAAHDDLDRTIKMTLLSVHGDDRLSWRDDRGRRS